MFLEGNNEMKVYIVKFTGRDLVFKMNLVFLYWQESILAHVLRQCANVACN